MQKQKTLAASFSMQGKGLHTGMDIQITFNPAPENHGYKIKRVDLEGEPVVDAVAENVAGTQRGTVLSKNGIQISTIEHAMAALYAFEIDNCLIEVNAPEFPILDGSSRYFCEAIQKAGIVEQNAPKDFYVVKHKIEVKDEASGSSLVILPDDKFSINVLISFDSPVLSNQFATLNDLSEFPTEIAASRTFVFVREVEMLLQNNLIKGGGDLDNAIVIYDQKASQEVLDKLADQLCIPHKDVTELGYINNKPLAFDNEPARHKLIDVIGDLALIGKPIRGRVIATRPGHKINNQLARVIRKDIKQNSIQAPVYNPERPPLIDVNRIRELLPHRYPFQLVDKIIEIGGNYIVGIKNVTTNEPYFQGHFPTEPVMPGVLQIEAMAQTGGILVLNSLEDPDYSTYILTINNVKFRHKVVPGDTLIMRLELLAPIRRGMSTMQGYTFVGDTLVSEAQFMALIEKNKK